MKDISGIYKIQSICKPERYYIGSSVNINKRWGEHLRELKKNKHHSGKLQNHFNKYRQSDLRFFILSGCDPMDLIQQEQFYIDSYKPYFNIYSTAGSPLGYKHSEEAKLKIKQNNSKYWLGKHLSEESRYKISKAREGTHATEETKRKIGLKSKGNKYNLGRKHSEEYIQKLRERKFSEEHRRKISEAGKGRKFSEEHKHKISEALKGRVISEETKLKMSAWQKGVKKKPHYINIRLKSA